MGGALIAMSGGVDSSVAALLAIERGLDCAGSMMKLFDNEDIGLSHGESGGKTCCAVKDAADAADVARKLGIPFFVFNFADTFKEEVINRFIVAYQNGRTPNPCIDCNRYLKFERLLRRAKGLEKEYVVTGHYARIETRAGNGRHILKKGADLSKDQSYVLYTMTQEQLGSVLFPLGELYKSRVREIALEHGFVNAEKRDSQDICFVPGGNYADFITDYIRQYTGTETPKGRFVDTNGGDLGEHKGIIHYTVGQRRGLGLSAAMPLYVREVHPKDNSVVVGTADDLYAKTFVAGDINLIPVEKLDTAMKVRARIRYNQREQPATVWQLDSDTLRVEFDSPQKAITKGQAAVLYDGETVIGGGTINEVLSDQHHEGYGT
jgi:tRNA-specific 2-thiouridylase